MSALGQKQTCAAHKPMSAKLPIVETLAPNRSTEFLPKRWTLGQLDMRLSALKKSTNRLTWWGHFFDLIGKGMNSMTEKLQRTEQVIMEAELRTMLDDEDVDSFADLISKGVAQVRGGAWRREQDGHWRFWQNPDWSPPDEDY